jgi:Domain of unknown function (DUF4864)
VSSIQGSLSDPERSSAVAGGVPAYPRPGGRRRGVRSAGRFQHAIEILWGGMIVAFVCVAALLALSWIQSQGAVAIVRAQATAIHDGKLDSAYDLFSDDYRASMSLQMFRRWLRRQPSLAAIQNVRIWGRSVWRGTAILWGSFQDDLGHSYPVRYSLIRENGDWRIDGFQVRADVPETLPNTQQFHYI